MKKLLSLCLAVVMMVCLLAGITANATTNEYYSLRFENFGITFDQSPASSGWTTQNITGDMQTAGCYQLVGVSSWYYGAVPYAKAANKTITSKIYIDTAGTYTAYMNVEQSGNGFKFAIDGQEVNTLFGSSSEAAGIAGVPYKYKTEKANRTWNLSAGWHTVTVTSTAAGTRFHTVFITNDTTLDPANIKYVRNKATVMEAPEVNLRAYEDVAAPVAGTLVATADENIANEQRTFVTLTWDPATDENGIVKYEIHNGTEYVDVTNEASYTVNNLWSASEYTFKLRVTDSFNNTAETTATATTNGSTDTEGPQWPTDAAIEVANAAFSSTITWPKAIDNRDVASYSIYEGTVDASNLIEEITEFDSAAETLSYTISLNPTEVKDIVVVAKDLGGNSSAELTTTIASTADAGGYTLRKENFELPADGSWDIEDISSNMQSRGCVYPNIYPSSGGGYGDVLRARKAGGEISANVYVETAGEYALFAQLLSGIQVKAALNGQKTSGNLSPAILTTESGERAYTWVKADRTWNLEAGWNTLTLITADASGGHVSLLYLTSSVNVEPNEIAYIRATGELVVDGKLNVALSEDTEGAEFAAGNIEVDYNSVNNAAEITWPVATDNPIGAAERLGIEASGLKAYRIYVGGEQIGEVNNATTSFEINETTLGRALVPGEVLDITVEALDGNGNKSTKTLSYEVSKFVISSFDVKNSTGVAASLADFTDGTVKAELVIKNVSEANADVRLAIAIYDSTGNLLYGDEIDQPIANDGVNTTVTATITGAPTDLTGCTVKAHLWHAGELSPASTQWTTIKIQ